MLKRMFLVGVMLLVSIPVTGHGLARGAETVSRNAYLVSGDVRPGVLIACEEEEFIFRNDQGRWSCRHHDLVYWGNLCEPAAQTYLCLRDGSLIVGHCVGWDRDRMRWQSPICGELTIPRHLCAGIVWVSPQRTGARDRLVGSLSSGPECVFFTNGDTLPASIKEWSGDPVIKVESALGEQEIDIHRLIALRFAGEELERQGGASGFPGLWIGLRDGSRVLLRAVAGERGQQENGAASADGLDVAGGERTVIQGIYAGGSVRIPINDVCFIQVVSPLVVYVSDLSPERYIHVPFLDYVRPFYRDRNVLGNYLRARGQLYLKGLGVFSASRLSYRLNRGYERFQAEVAIDDAAGRGGSVVFRVLVNGEVKTLVGPVRGGEPPKTIAVDVRGAERLDLIVEFGERADELDYANWLNARLIPAPRGVSDHGSGSAAP